MKITVRVNELKRILDEACVIVRPKAPQPILANVKLDVIAGVGWVTASDMDITIRQQLEIVDSDGDGSFLMPARKARDFLSRCTGGCTTLDYAPGDSDGAVSVTGGNLAVKLPSRSVTLFQRLESLPAPVHMFSLKFLKEVIGKVDFAVPPKQERHATPTILVESTECRLRAVGTDGYRIAIADAPRIDSKLGILLPKSLVPILQRRRGDFIGLSESDTSYFFQTDRIALSCRKQIVKFPPYERVFDSWFRTRIDLNADKLRKSIETVLPLADDIQPFVWLETFGRKVLVTTSSENGTASSELMATAIDGDQVRVKLKPKYVLEFLAQVSGDLTLEVCNSRRLVRLASGNFQCFVMPLH